MQTDWEIARTTTTHVWREWRPSNLRVECQRTSMTRLRVAVADHMGQHLFRGTGAVGEYEIGIATANAKLGPRLTLAFGDGYPQPAALGHSTADQSPLRSVEARGVLYEVEHRRRLELRTAHGRTMSWRACHRRVITGCRVGDNVVPVLCQDLSDYRANPGSVFPDVQLVPPNRSLGTQSFSWLWSPLALSSLFARSWSRSLRGSSTPCVKMPAAIQIIDDGTSAPTDLEGTRRRRFELVDQSGTRHGPTTLTSAATVDELSGHAGIAGPEIEELRVVPRSVVVPSTDCDFHVVVAARRLAASQNLLVLTFVAASLPRPDRTFTAVVRIGNLDRFFDHGRWHGPSSRGNSGWMSPWYEMTEPSVLSLSVLSLEESACG